MPCPLFEASRPLNHFSENFMHNSRRLLIQIKYTGTRMPDDSHFFDDAAYISHIRDEAATKEATIFHTAHCPQNRYLLASSNKGRIAIWDLSFYLFPAASASLLTTCPSLSFASRASPLLTRGFSRHLRQYECRMFPAALRRKGFPCLSIQVSERAINHVMFLGEGSTSPLLVLAGDDGIYVWPWAHILKLLSQAIGEDGGMDQDCTQGIPGNSCITQDLGAPSALLKALPSQEAWPFLTESNQVAPSFHSSSSTSPSVCFSACGDALVRQWDLETQKCASVLIGHTGYVHAIQSLGPGTAAPGLVLSGGEDGKIGVWDVRACDGRGGGVASLVRMMEGWERGEVLGEKNRTSGGGIGSNSVNRREGPSWISSLDVDRGGNFMVAAGGMEGGMGGGKPSSWGVLSVVHLPSFSMVSAARTDCAIQGVAFEEEKIISVGNERQALHWARPGLGKAARVTTDIPSVFSVNVRRSPPNGDGVTVYAGRADHVSVFVHPEHSAFNLKFR